MIDTDVPFLKKTAAGAVININTPEMDAYIKRKQILSRKRTDNTDLNNRINILEAKMDSILALLTNKANNG